MSPPASNKLSRWLWLAGLLAGGLWLLFLLGASPNKYAWMADDGAAVLPQDGLALFKTAGLLLLTAVWVLTLWFQGRSRSAGQRWASWGLAALLLLVAGVQLGLWVAQGHVQLSGAGHG